MKLLISNQYGAILMALFPFLYALSLAPFNPTSILLLLAWIFIYLMSYPLLNLFKNKNIELYKKWTLIYAAISMVFAALPLYENWQIIYFMLPMLPLVCINIYYTKQKNERSLVNDFVAILIFALAGMGAYYFSTHQIDHNIWKIALYPSLFFIGTTLYVKSILRERKNPRYYHAAILWYLICMLVFISLKNNYMVLAFLPSFIRACRLPKYKLSAKQVGLIEFAISILFFITLVLEP